MGFVKLEHSVSRLVSEVELFRHFFHMNVFWLPLLKVMSIISVFWGHCLAKIGVEQLGVVVSVKSSGKLVNIVLVNENTVGN